MQVNLTKFNPNIVGEMDEDPHGEFYDVVEVDNVMQEMRIRIMNLECEIEDLQLQSIQ